MSDIKVSIEFDKKFFSKTTREFLADRLQNEDQKQNMVKLMENKSIHA